MNNQKRKAAFVACIAIGIMAGWSTGSLTGMLTALVGLFAGISAGLFIRPVFDAKEGIDTKRPHL